MDVETFRTDFTEFADATAYPDSGVNYWLTVAGLMLDPSRWATLLDLGTELFVAHNLALERQAQKTAANGGVPGISSGPLSAKAVDKVSASYDTAAGIVKDAGHWNLTTYGTRFIDLALMMGSGGLQLI
jgi:hypothetical protein